MESHNYEHYRNLTLMFFFEKLLEKGGPRTLHDLSCQFGTKGFSKEMRQIAGGSQSGLRKFLQQYPSLFTVEGEWVSITQTIKKKPTKKVQGSNSDGCPADRDYAVEAVEYFKNKLRQYGAGTEVPIKSLLGHRSQAPPEVRHISGQHVKEFKDFLARYPEDFVVKEEIVFLKEYEGKITTTFQECEEFKIDPVVTNQFLTYFRETVDQKGPLHIDQLFELVTNHFNINLWSTLFKTPQDLCTFLKIYSHLFHVQANMITLVPHKPYAQSPLVSAYTKHNQNQQNHQNHQNHHQNHHQNIHQNQHNHQQPQPSPVGLGSSESLSGKTCQSPGMSLSPVRTPPKADSPRERESAVNLSQATLKQRVNLVVMRMIAQNSDQDQRNQREAGQDSRDSRDSRDLREPRDSRDSRVGQQPGQAVVGESREAVKQRVLGVSRVVVSTRESLQIVEDILRAGQPVGLDGEGVNLGPKGQLTLVQVSRLGGEVIIFDVQTTPALMTQGGLQSLLESEHIIKVVHDCRNDSAALHFQYEVSIKNVFDTQAAHAVLQLQETGKPVYKVKNVSLNALCELYNAPVNPMKEQVKNIYRRDQKFWARRPLTRDMICYAGADVLALVPTIYTAMASQIKPEFSNLFSELCEEQVMLYIQGEEVKNRKKQRKVETEVADLRLKLATIQSRNIVLSNREIRLLRYIELTEEDKEKLKGSYKVAKKLEKLESRDKNGDSEEDDDYDCDPGEYPSLDSFTSNVSDPSPASPETSLSPRPTSSPRSGPSPGITNTGSGSVSLAESMQMVDEILANGNLDRMDRIEKLENILSAATNLSTPSPQPPSRPVMVDSETQTLSTGDIVITKVFFPEGQQPSSQDSTPQNSPKKGIKIPI